MEEVCGDRLHIARYVDVHLTSYAEGLYLMLSLQRTIEQQSAICSNARSEDSKRNLLYKFLINLFAKFNSSFGFIAGVSVDSIPYTYTLS